MRPKAEFIDTEEQAKKALAHLMKHPDVGLDTETTGLGISTDIVLFWSAASTDRRFCILPEFLPVFQPLYDDTKIVKHFTNAKFDLHMLANTGIYIPTDTGTIVDTLVLDWLLDENRGGRHGLKECIYDHFGSRMPSFKDVFGKHIAADKQAGILEAVIRGDDGDDAQKRAIEYASRDAWETLRLSLYLQQQLDLEVIRDSYSLLDHYYDVEEPFTRTLFRMERRGVMVDTDYLEDLRPGIEKRIEEIERDFNRTAGHPVNPKSNKQLAALFFDEFGIMPTKYGVPSTKTGDRSPSADKEVLGAWSEGSVTFWDGENPMPEHETEEERDLVQQMASSLLEYRGLTKFLGTYVTGLEKWIDDDYRIHPRLNQHITVTGRLSSSKPNLQNIPRKDNDEFQIRDAFIADGGYQLYVADYAQLEMRVMAHFSEDPAMIQAILDGVDLHCFTVSEMRMGYTYDEVLDAKERKEANLPLSSRQKRMIEQRSGAKAVGFGLIYGIGEVKLGKQLGLDIHSKVSRGKKREICPEAGKLMRKYFDVFPEIRKFIKGTHRATRENGFVQTYLGRFRRLPTIDASRRDIAAQAERQSVNSIIQGTAADVARKAMIKCEFDEDLRAAGVKQLLQIHDELMFEVPEYDDVMLEAQQRIQAHMEDPFGEPLLVPLPAEGSFAVAWGNAK